VADAHEELSLADWRRRLAELYAEVHALARLDPHSAWAHWRATREWLYREHRQSPVPVAERDAFRLQTWPYADALRFEVLVEPRPAAAVGSAGGLAGEPRLPLPVSAGAEVPSSLLGVVRLPFASGERLLNVYWLSGYAGGLFLPFRDTTNGRETYGAGRYVLDGAKSADLGGDLERGTLVVDFNFAYQPSCAFDPRWACPLAPPENRLDIGIEAGERLA
jgi:uncharacterized protein (DUF1684 family)